jgi:hypothetical protein
MMDKLAGKLSATSQILCGVLSSDSVTMIGTLSAGYILQDKEVIPSAEEQTITADAGFGGLSSVKVGAIPQNYGLITYDGSSITVS